MLEDKLKEIVDRVAEKSLWSEDTIAQIIQAFKDEGYTHTHTSKADIKKWLTELPNLPMPPVIMSGQEFYNRFVKEYSGLTGYVHPLEAAKEAAGL